MSLACPCAPPSGWCIMILALGRDFLLPLAPAPRRKAPIEAAVPKQTVETSQGTYCRGRANEEGEVAGGGGTRRGC